MEATTSAVVMTEEKVEEPDTRTTVVTTWRVSDVTRADVIVVALLRVERLMVEASLPLPTTTY